MRDQKISFISPQLSRSEKPLILVVEPNWIFGTRLVQLLTSGTCCHAMLATGIAQAHRMLQQFTCDAVFLYDGSFSRNDLDSLDLLPYDAEMPTLTILAGLPLVPNQPATWHLQNLVTSIKCVRYIRNSTGDACVQPIEPFSSLCVSAEQESGEDQESRSGTH